MGRGINAKSVFTLEIRDTNTHRLPDGTAAHASMSKYDLRTKDASLVKIVNDLDQDVSVNVEGTTFDDPSMSKSDDELSANITIAAGKVDTIVMSAWAYARVRAKCSVAPAAGELKVVFQADEQH